MALNFKMLTSLRASLFCKCAKDAAEGGRDA